MPNNEMYGFWPYDNFPHYVGGIIHSPEEGVKHFGIGWWKWGNTGRYVKPTIIVPVSVGKKMQVLIDNETAIYRASIEKLTKHARNNISDIMKGKVS